MRWFWEHPVGRWDDSGSWCGWRRAYQLWRVCADDDGHEVSLRNLTSSLSARCWKVDMSHKSCEERYHSDFFDFLKKSPERRREMFCMPTEECFWLITCEARSLKERLELELPSTLTKSKEPQAARTWQILAQTSKGWLPGTEFQNVPVGKQCHLSFCSSTPVGLDSWESQWGVWRRFRWWVGTSCWMIFIGVSFPNGRWWMNLVFRLGGGCGGAPMIAILVVCGKHDFPVWSDGILWRFLCTNVTSIL